MIEVGTLVAGAVAMLTPYVAAGATKAAESLGESLAGKTGEIWTKVCQWLGGDDRSAKVVADYKSEPALYQGSLEHVLTETLENDPALVDELKQLLGGLGSRLEVRQKVETLAGTLTGIKVRHVTKGLDAFVSQDLGTIEKGGKSTGIEIDSM